ncbi:MAG: conjugal transfer protein TraG N-terminal domain-containing protein [bacterium]|nr:conjugal transfer protein TraG N-terminal domain-containing protein [bacterium]
MSVSSVLEGYLSVYGWQLYATIFFLVVAFGGVLYPIARIVFDAAISQAESDGDPALGARSLLARLAIYFLVLVLGMLPLVPLEVSGLSVQNQCGRDALQALGQNFKPLQSEPYGFNRLRAAKVPLLAYAAMALAAGFNAVINKATPCLADITNLNLAANALDLSQAEDPNSLYAQVSRFERECGVKASRIAHDFLDDAKAPESRKYMNDLLEQYARGDERLRRIQLVYFGSKFYQDNFYQPCAGGGDPNTPAGKLCGLIAPLRAENPVSGFGYDAGRDGDASRYEAAHNLGRPTCQEWWNDGTRGIRAQVLKAATKKMGKSVRSLTFGRPCRLDLGDTGIVGDKLCAQWQVADEDVLVEQTLLSPKRQLGFQGPEMTWQTGLLGAALFAFTDVAQNIATQAAGYWVTIYLMKIGASLLQPFLLMTVYMLWALFVVIGEMRGMTLVKGMMLIFVLGILPSLWGFAEYIDDQLFLVLYPGAEPITNPLAIPGQLLADPSVVERLILLLVAGAYYIALPLLLLYLIAEVGGPTGAANMSREGIGNPSHGLGNIGGQPVASASFNNSIATRAYGRWKGKSK